MKTLARKITASKDGATLFIRVNKVKLTIPWLDSKYHRDETVIVAVDKSKSIPAYSVRPADKRLPWNETNWRLVDNGVSSQNN